MASNGPRVKIQPRMPSGDKNGLGPIEAALVDKPHQRHVLMGIIDCDQVATNIDDGTDTPRLRFLRIEIVPADDYDAAEKLFRQAWAQRQYEPMLPYEGQADRWGDVFKNMDGEREDIKDWEMKQSPVVGEPPIDAEVVSDVVDDVFNGPVHEGPEAPVEDPPVMSDSTELAIPDWVDQPDAPTEIPPADGDDDGDYYDADADAVAEDPTDPGDEFRPPFSG